MSEAYSWAGPGNEAKCSTYGGILRASGGPAVVTQ